MATPGVIRVGIDSTIQRTRNLTGIPYFIYNDELSGLYGSAVLRELGEIIDYYNIYEQGAEFVTEGNNGDYVPSQLKYKQIRTLIDKEARFLFSKRPDIWVDVTLTADMSKAAKDALKAQQALLQSLVDTVVKKNNFSSKLLRAAKDCFIGKRVALVVNFNESGIKLSFVPSLEFVFETDIDDADVLTKFVTFYSTVDSVDRDQQRIYKKKYYMHEDGFCHIIEEIYDGLGNVVEEVSPDFQTKFSYIPAFIILNDGLTGDVQGVSEVNQLGDYESAYSRLANADQDAERKGMNPVRYAIDMNPRTTQGLSTAAGAFWDLASDENKSGESKGTVGVLDTPMTYSGALGVTLDRIKNTAYEQIDMPNISPDALKGVVSSGKTLKAIYWGLVVRCDEKMLVWRPALENMVRTIIDGSLMYPEIGTMYTNGEAIPEIVYDARVDNQYPLPEDEAEEKTVDLAEVQAQTMSKRAYMVKWRGLTDDEAQAELQQIALERELLEDSFMPSPATQPGDTGNNGGEEDDITKKTDLEDDPSPVGV